MPTSTKPRKIVARDVNVWAAKVVSATTGMIVPADLIEQEKRKIAAEKAAAGERSENPKNPAAVSLGRLGGLKGGKARAKTLSAKHRSEIAKKAAETRWKRRDEILRLTKKQLTARQIADKLGVSIETIRRAQESAHPADEPLAI